MLYPCSFKWLIILQFCWFWSFLKIPFSKTVYIERSDFRLKDSKDYYGLAPGKSVLLRYCTLLRSPLLGKPWGCFWSEHFLFCCYRYAFPIKCTEVILADDKETVIEIRAEYDPSKTTKPKVCQFWNIVIYLQDVVGASLFMTVLKIFFWIFS